MGKGLVPCPVEQKPAATLSRIEAFSRPFRYSRSDFSKFRRVILSLVPYELEGFEGMWSQAT